MKKTVSVLLTFILLLSAALLQAGAVASEVQQTTETIHTEYGDIQVDTVLILYPSAARSSTQKADRIKTYSYSGQEIASVTLSATFGYDGKTSWVESTSSSHTTSGGWSYKNEEITSSGGTAALTASLTKLLNPTIPVEITLSCSPTGTIS